MHGEHEEYKICVLPPNVTLVFLTPIGYNVCSTNKLLIEQLNKYITAFIKEPETNVLYNFMCEYSHLNSHIFSYAATYFGNQTYLDLSLSKYKNDKVVDGINVYSKDTQEFINTNVTPMFNLPKYKTKKKKHKFKYIY